MSRIARRAFLTVAGVCLGALALTGLTGYSPPFGIWRRASADPLLSPAGSDWQSAGVFNPAVVYQDSQYVMLYRAQDRKGTSRLGYATSRDGIHFHRRPDPVFVSE